MSGLLARTLIVSLLFTTIPLLAHEGLHEQLDAMTKRIAAEPRNAALRLARGELYRLHAQWDLARADYDAAADLDPSLRAVAFARGRMELEAGRPEVALPLLDRFLADHPEHGEALLTRARALAKLGRADPAIADYDAAIAHTDPPNPDLYYERARFLVSLGATHVDAALRGLDEGLTRLGMIPSLQQQAIELARNARRYDDALDRLTKLAATSPRAETYLVERAEILEEAGRRADALATYRDVRARLAAGPRNARSIELTEKIEKALARLEP